MSDHALLHAVSALEADPSSVHARSLVVELIAGYSWHLPQMRIQIGSKVDHLIFREPNHLWVASSNKWNTVSRWDIEKMAAEAVLFPLKGGGIQSVLCDPSGRWLIVGRRGRLLLCDARTLKPIRDMGVLLEDLMPSSAFAFSSDGLLLVHPAIEDSDARKIVWHLRDSKSGEIVRTADSGAEPSRRALAAFVDRKECKVMHADGSVWVMPVSPTDPCRWELAKDLLHLEHAQYAPDGEAAHVLLRENLHDSGSVMELPSMALLSDSVNLLKHYPWSLKSSVWSGLYRNLSHAPRVEGDCMWLVNQSAAPIRSGARISAFHQSGKYVIVANEHGKIDFFQTVKLPPSDAKNPVPRILDEASFSSLEKIASALTGMILDANTGGITYLDAEARLQAARTNDFDLLADVFPEIDFKSYRVVVDDMKWWQSDESAVSNLKSRLIDADPEFSDDVEIAELFESGDIPRIITSIEKADPANADSAKYLQRALSSSHAELVEACLRRFTAMPSMLRLLAESRMAWLLGRKSDAIASWPEPFPNYESIRLVEDWHGWERADFSEAFKIMSDCVTKEIELLKFPTEPSDDQLKALVMRFEDQQIIRAIGRARYSKACIDAAYGFCKWKDHAKTALVLATRARNLGYPPEPCLRAEAMAHTVLGDYSKAHEQWLMLIGEFPVESHEAGDYAEAAYTAFENANGVQAMEILITGMRRFPSDADFALRAGWIALLTDHHERAYQFLLNGQQIGYRPEKIENATALLAVAAMECGAKAEALAYYVKLVETDQRWKEAKAIAELDITDEMKSVLESVRVSSALVPPTR